MSADSKGLPLMRKRSLATLILTIVSLFSISLLSSVDGCCRGGGGGGGGAQYKNRTDFTSKEDFKYNFNLLREDIKRSTKNDNNSMYNLSILHSPILFTRVLTMLALVSTDFVKVGFELTFRLEPKEMRRFHEEHIASIIDAKLDKIIDFNGIFHVEKPYEKKINKTSINEFAHIYNTSVYTEPEFNWGVTAVDHLNDNVEESTAKMIQRFFDLENFGEHKNIGTVFNTLYFQDEWQYNISGPTFPIPFHHKKETDNIDLWVDALVMESEFGMKEDTIRKIKYVELPLSDASRFSLLVMLPTEFGKINEVAHNLNASDLEEIIKEEKPLKKVLVFLPQVNRKGRREALRKRHMKNVTQDEMLELATIFTYSYLHPKFKILSPCIESVYVKEIDQQIALIIDRKGIVVSGIVNAYLERHFPDEPDDDKKHAVKPKKSTLPLDENEEESIPSTLPLDENKRKKFKFDKSSTVFKCDQPFFIVLVDKWHQTPLLWGTISF